MTKKRIGLFLGPILFLLVRYFFEPQGLSDAANAVLASTLWIAAWWITEAIPIAATALLPIILFPLTGALDLAATTASYGHKYIFLFIGGFMLAIAIERWNLHKRIALHIIKLVGTNLSMIILGFMLATAFLSMWISNTATAVMIMPVGMAIISQLQDNPATQKNENGILGKALMLAIAYSASIGGMATLIGTPPNLVLAGVVEKSLGTEITFLQWFLFGFPLSMTLLFISWQYLTRCAFKLDHKEFPGGKVEIHRQLLALGKMSYEEKVIAIVFTLTAIAWICRSFLLSQWIPAIDDTIIAVTSALLLFLIPTRDKSQSILTWESAVRLPWGILILFGGGMALATAFESSGLAVWIGNQLGTLEGISLFVLLLIIIAAVNFLTEITSNLATTAMLLPIFISVAAVLEINPYYLLVSTTVAASCAFMLPVATPPNTVVFGSGYLSIKDMVQKGVWMNIISIIILTLFVYFILPLLWDL